MRFIVAALSAVAAYAAGLEQVRIAATIAVDVVVSSPHFAPRFPPDAPPAPPYLPPQIHISYTGIKGEIAVDFVSDVASGAVLCSTNGEKWVRNPSSSIHFGNIGYVHQALCTFPATAGAKAFYRVASPTANSTAFTIVPVPARGDAEVFAVFGDFGLTNDVRHCFAREYAQRCRAALCLCVSRHSVRPPTCRCACKISSPSRRRAPLTASSTSATGCDEDEWWGRRNESPCHIRAATLTRPSLPRARTGLRLRLGCVHCGEPVHECDPAVWSVSSQFRSHAHTFHSLSFLSRPACPSFSLYSGRAPDDARGRYVDREGHGMAGQASGKSAPRRRSPSAHVLASHAKALSAPLSRSP